MGKFKKGARRLISVWYLFAGWAFVAIVALMLIFGYKTAYKPEEQITMFVTANEVKNERLNEHLNEVKPEYLSRIKLDYCDVPDNETIYNVNWMQATALGTDIYILPESKISAEACSAYFMSLTSEFYNKNFTGCETYVAEENVYGLKIDKENLKNYLGFADENYYLCFGRHCVHMGNLYGFNYDGAVVLAQKLLCAEGR